MPTLPIHSPPANFLARLDHFKNQLQCHFQLAWRIAHCAQPRNTLANTQQINVTGELDLRAFIKNQDSCVHWKKMRHRRRNHRPTINPIHPAPKEKRIKDKTQPLVLSPAVKVVGRIFTAMKRISLNYSENSATTVYGYTDSTRNLGMNFRSNAPGLGFVFGQQPDTNFINKLASRGLLTADPNFNFLNKQDYNQKIGINAQLIPMRDLTIDVNIDKSFGKTYSELYKDTLGFSGNFNRLSPYAGGSFSISYISYKTLFEK